MARRPITDDLLQLTIENKLETGVSASRIRTLVEAFAQEESGDETAEIVGFLWVEDIPLDRRGIFLTALIALSPEPDQIAASLRGAAPSLATPFGSLLTRARAALGFVPA
jgi:hypothetical protein